MRYVLYGLLLIGGFGFGADFRNWIRTFVTVGIPNAWENNIATNRCYRAFRNALWIAVALPILWTIFALIIARYSVDVAQWFMVMGVLPSFFIFGKLLILAGVFAGIAVAISPFREATRERLQKIRRGFERLVGLGMLWVLFVGFILFMVGLEASWWALTASIWAIVIYGMATYVFKLPVTWLESVMTNTGLWSFIVIFALTILMIFSPTRKFAASAGINPGKFVHGGVVDVSAFTSAEKTAQRRIQELCGGKAIQDILDAIAKAPTPKAVREQQEILKKRQHECL